MKVRPAVQTSASLADVSVSFMLDSIIDGPIAAWVRLDREHRHGEEVLERGEVERTGDPGRLAGLELVPKDPAAGARLRDVEERRAVLPVPQDVGVAETRDPARRRLLTDLVRLLLRRQVAVLRLELGHREELPPELAGSNVVEIVRLRATNDRPHKTDEHDDRHAEPDVDEPPTAPRRQDRD